MEPTLLKPKNGHRTKKYKVRRCANKRPCTRCRAITAASPAPAPPPLEPPLITPANKVWPPINNDLPNLPAANRTWWFIDPNGLKVALNCPWFSCSVSTSPVSLMMLLYVFGYSSVVEFLQALGGRF